MVNYTRFLRIVISIRRERIKADIAEFHYLHDINAYKEIMQISIAKNIQYPWLCQCRRNAFDQEKKMHFNRMNIHELRSISEFKLFLRIKNR
jgi:hypothetical protein